MYEDKEMSKEHTKKEKKLLKERKFFKKDSSKAKEKKVKKEKTTKKVLAIKPDFISILIKFAIFLLIAFVIIFVFTKIRQSNEKNTFTNNMEKMKEVAYIYYKVESHRPVEINEEVQMTLGDMEKGSLISELKDTKKNVCSKDYSYVSLTKKAEDEYEMIVYLTCGGEAQSASYDISYSKTNESAGNVNQVVLYEMKRVTKSENGYSCPEGYLNGGRYCIKRTTDVIKATPKYKVTPAVNTSARYKAAGYTYEYAEPIVSLKENALTCVSGYQLENGKCVRKSDVYYKTSSVYSCPNGGTLSGSRCLFTTYPDYISERAYCKKGHLINGDSCYISKDYNVKCLNGKYDSNRNSCYKTYKASEELSDWLFDGKVTYSDTRDVEDTETVRYEEVSYSNNKITYRKYIRKYIKVCDNDDELAGSTCRHYDEDYIQKSCSSNYTLSKDGSECYRIVDANYKEIAGTYTCPDGYRKKGSGEDMACYRYENASKSTSKTAYCKTGYDLTSENTCVKSMEPNVVEQQKTYTCPSGYTQSGTGERTKCYKKTTTDSYYYCANPSAKLEGTRCIIPEKTTFVTYKCPYGYDLNGTECIKYDKKETILATKTDTNGTKEEIIWSKTKELDGWTFTGNTKISE